MSYKYSTRYQAIGQHIQKVRQSRGLTQEDLAEKAGISISYLTKIEAQNCDKPFSLEVVFDIADALNVLPAELLNGIK